jgi:hypothetical protein
MLFLVSSCPMISIALVELANLRDSSRKLRYFKDVFYSCGSDDMSLFFVLMRCPCKYQRYNLDIFIISMIIVSFHMFSCDSTVVCNVSVNRFLHLPAVFIIIILIRCSVPDVKQATNIITVRLFKRKIRQPIVSFGSHARCPF